MRRPLIFAFAATLLVAGVGALLGLALFGSGAQLSFGASVLRLFAVCGYLTMGPAALGAIGLFVSTLTEQPIGATIAIVIVNVASFTERRGVRGHLLDRGLGPLRQPDVTS